MSVSLRCWLLSSLFTTSAFAQNPASQPVSTTFSQPTATTSVTPLPAANPTARGRGLLGGSLTLDYVRYRVEESKTTTFAAGASVSAGRFWRDGWLVGGSLSASRSATQFSPELVVLYEPQQTAVGGSVFIRRYWRVGGLHPFLGGGVAGNVVRSTGPGDITQTRRNLSSTSVNAVAQAGLLYPLSNRFGLDVTATSTAFPFQVSSVAVGLTWLTGGRGQGPKPPAIRASQTARGRWLLGGNVGFTANTAETQPPVISAEEITDFETSRFSLGPSVGVFVADGTVLGLAVPISATRTRLPGQPVPLTTFGWGLAPFVKRYVGNRRLRPVGTAELRFETTRTRAADGTGSQRTLGAGVSAGLAYLLADRFIIEAALARLSADYSPVSADAGTWHLRATGTFSPGFTINYAF